MNSFAANCARIVCTGRWRSCSMLRGIHAIEAYTNTSAGSTRCQHPNASHTNVESPSETERPSTKLLRLELVERRKPNDGQTESTCKHVIIWIASAILCACARSLLSTHSALILLHRAHMSIGVRNVCTQRTFSIMNMCSLCRCQSHMHQHPTAEAEQKYNTKKQKFPSKQTCRHWTHEGPAGLRLCPWRHFLASHEAISPGNFANWLPLPTEKHLSAAAAVVRVYARRFTQTRALRTHRRIATRFCSRFSWLPSAIHWSGTESHGRARHSNDLRQWASKQANTYMRVANTTCSVSNVTFMGTPRVLRQSRFLCTLFTSISIDSNHSETRTIIYWKLESRKFVKKKNS